MENRLKNIDEQLYKEKNNHKELQKEFNELKLKYDNDISLRDNQHDSIKKINLNLVKLEELIKSEYSKYEDLNSKNINNSLIQFKNIRNELINDLSRSYSKLDNAIKSIENKNDNKDVLNKLDHYSDILDKNYKNIDN